MYHVSDLTNWAHHLHFPHFNTLENAENLLKSKTFWAVIMFMTIIIGLSIVAIFTSPETTSSVYPYSPYYPFYP